MISPEEEQAITEAVARSHACRDAIAYLTSLVAAQSKDADRTFREMAEALNDRLDELPEGISPLKEMMRAEGDWIVGAARAFHGLRKP